MSRNFNLKFIVKSGHFGAPPAGLSETGHQKLDDQFTEGCREKLVDQNQSDGKGKVDQVGEGRDADLKGLLVDRQEVVEKLEAQHLVNEVVEEKKIVPGRLDVLPVRINIDALRGQDGHDLQGEVG